MLKIIHETVPLTLKLCWKQLLTEKERASGEVEVPSLFGATFQQVAPSEGHVKLKWNSRKEQ